ncbi:MAG: prepilin peptidase [Roseburia sp.]
MYTIVFIYLLGAAGFDLWSGKIPNWMVALGVGGGVIYRIWEDGIYGLGVAVLNMLFPIVLLFLLFLMHAIGAGDIKLFSVIAIWTGIEKSCYVMAAAFIIGAIWGLVKLLFQRNLAADLMLLLQCIRTSVLTGHPEIFLKAMTWDKHKIHFAVAIAMGFGIVAWQEVVDCISLQ